MRYISKTSVEMLGSHFVRQVVSEHDHVFPHGAICEQRVERTSGDEPRDVGSEKEEPTIYRTTSASEC